MRQLGALDNLMIMGDIPNIPLHMSALMVYETGNKKGANALYQSLLDNLDKVAEQHFPILRSKVEGVALQMDKAYWVEDPNFTPSYHVSRVALPKPQDWTEVYKLFAQFHAQPLDRTRPLWEVLFVEGLDRLTGVPRGSTALFFKIHHAVMDGKSALRLIAGLHSPDPGPGSPTFIELEPDDDQRDKDFEPPSWWAKYGRAWWHSVERPLDLAATMAKLLPTFLQRDEGNDRDKGQVIPQVRFNQPVVADRVIGHVRMDMQQVRGIEAACDCTINDVALCVVAGALRKYLLAERELPDANLQALMPIDIRREDKDGHLGNQVSVAKVSLHTDIEAPQERLRLIASDSSRVKRQRSKGSSRALLRLIDDVHPAVVLSLGQWLVSSGYMDKLHPFVNTVITNVPGFKTQGWLAGSRLIDYLGFGPLAPNMGLFHTVSSTHTHVNISFLSTPECIDEGSDYLAALQASWLELSQL